MVGWELTTPSVGAKCDKQLSMTCGLGSGVLLAAFVASVAYWLLAGHRTAHAVRHHLERAIMEPSALVAGAPMESRVVGLLHHADARRLADYVAARRSPRLVVVRGRRGSGKTSFLVALIAALARNDVLGICVTLRSSESLDSIEQLARASFLSSIEEIVYSEGDADIIWRTACATRKLVVIIDELDDVLASDSYHDLVALERSLLRLLSRDISVVIATTMDLKFEDARLPVVQEHLDRVDLHRGTEFVRAAIVGVGIGSARMTLPPEVTLAIEAQRTPEGPLHASAIYHLSRIIELAGANLLPRRPPERLEQRRAQLLEVWVNALVVGKVGPRRLGFVRDDAHRRRTAHDAAQLLAQQLLATREASVDRAKLASPQQAIDDAVLLGLLQVRHGRVEFANEAMHAHYTSARTDEGQLLNTIDDPPTDDPDAAARWREALVVWAANSARVKRARRLAERLVAAEEQRKLPRPEAVALAARVAMACGADELHERIATCARGVVGDDRRALEGHADEHLLRALVNACAELGDSASSVLCVYSEAAPHVVQWTATRILARRRDAVTAYRDHAQSVLERARGGQEALQPWTHPLPNAIGSLAWTMPTMADADPELSDAYAELWKLCTEPGDLSPLQGEVALARGLTLAAGWRHAGKPSLEATSQWLLAGQPRTWFARLLLVHALTRHGRPGRSHGRNVAATLQSVVRREPHPLVREAARLGEAELRRGDLRQFIWDNERDAVATARPGSELRSRLTGDIVMLMNAIFERTRSSHPDAVKLAMSNELPYCLGRPLPRMRCGCLYELCDLDVRTNALLRPRSPFGEQFCREQQRLVDDYGPPRWQARHGWPGAARDRRRYWEELANLVRRARTS